MEEEVLIEKVVSTELPKGWSWRTLEEVSEVVGGATPKTGNAANFEGGDIAWLTPADLSGYTDKFIERGARYITKTGLESCSTKLVPKGTVLFTSRAPIGYVAIANAEVCTNQGFKSYVPDTTQVTSDYLYWWLKGAKPMAEAVASGTTFLELSTVKARKLPIPIAPLPEQRRIVSAIELQLGRLDAAVARLNSAKAKLKRYKQAVLKAAVEGELIEGLEPDDWKEVCVEDVILGAQYGSSEKSNEDPAGIPVLAMGNIRDGELIFDKLKYYPSSYTEINKFVLRDGDVLFNRTNSPELVGKSAIYRSSYPKAVFASYLIRLTVNKDICDPDWLNYYMNSPQQRHYIKTVVTQQVGQANVNGTKMKAMPLPLPGIKVQRKLVKEISTRLARANEMMTILDAELIQSTRLRQAVLKRAFEGRLV